MTDSQALILGILQGITEFLPISSSGHLVLGEFWLNLQVEQLKSFDVVVHLGTLLAIFIYFWVDFKRLFATFFRMCGGKVDWNDSYVKLIGYIVIGTVPAVFAGLLLEDWIDGIFRNVTAVATSMIVMGLLFLLGEYIYGLRKAGKMSWWKASLIGLAQAVALIPGISRSGSTITAGIMGGIERSEAARFSFLLGSPAIAGAGILTALKVFKEGAVLDWRAMAIGFVSSFVFGLLSVHFLMKFLKKRSLVVFAAYLIILGSVSLILLNF